MEITGNDLLKKRRERINDNQTKEKISGKDLLQMHKKYQTYRAMDTSEVNDAYIDTFYKDWNSFSSSAEKDYEGLGWSNASSSYDSRNSAWNELSKRADTIEAYYYKNRNNVKNEDGYASMINDLNEIRSSASKILKSFQTEADYYSNWATEDEYNEWNKYSYITGLDNFAEKSKYVSTYRGGEKYNAFTNTYTDTGYDDIMYDYINRDENARATKAVNDISSNASFLGFDKSERREMTDDEISIFNYIYATQGKDAAYEYVDHITAGPVGLNARQRAKETEEWASYAKESPVASSVFSVFEAPLKGLSYIGQAADYLDDGKIDQNTGYNKFSYVNSAIRNQVTQDVEKNWGGVGSFAYQTGMSMADFLFTTAISGGNSALSLGIMGTGAAADTVIYAKDRGLSDNQAFALGTIAGAAEIVTEKISLDALLDATQLGKNALGYIAKNMIAEGSEEVTSSAINLIADVLISKDKSEWRTAIDAYKTVGMDDKEAFWHAVGDQALSFGLDFLGGAASGGVMGGGGATVNAINTAIDTANQGSAFKGVGADLTREALDFNPENRYAQKMQGKIDNGKTLSNYQLGKLVQQNEKGLYSQDKSTMKAAVEKRLAEFGVVNNVPKASEAIVKKMVGEKLTRAETEFLRNEAVLDAAYELSEEFLNQSEDEIKAWGEAHEGDPLWATKIGTERIGTDVYNRGMPAEESAEASVDSQNAVSPASAVLSSSAWNDLQPSGEINTQESIAALSSEKAFGQPKTIPALWENRTEAPAGVKNTGAVRTNGAFEGNSSSAKTPTAAPQSALEKESKKYGAQAGAFVHIYNEGQDVEKYGRAYQMAYDMGKSGIALSYAMKSSATAYLTDTQRQLAYEAGQAAADMIANKKNSVNEKNKTSENDPLKRKKGKVKGEGITIADLKKTFNDTQNTVYRILSSFAEATGIDIVVYDSKTSNDFERSGDKIYIDINNGFTKIKTVDDLAKYTVLRTFSHDFMQFVEKWNPVWYNEFRKAVFAELEAKGEDVNALIEEVRKQNPQMDYDQASREVIAEAMTDILPDSHFIETLAKKHKNIFREIHTKLKEFLADLKAYFKSVGENPSKAANALKEQADGTVRYLENIVKMFDEGAVTAVENYRRSVMAAKTEASGANVQDSVKDADNETKIKEATENAEQRTENKEGTDETYAGTDRNHEGESKETFGKNENRPRIPETMGETGSSLRQDRSPERHHQDEVDFLFDRKNDISPEKDSPLYSAQKTVIEEYGMECYVLKTSAWKRKNPACTGEGKIYLSEGINSYTLATFVPHETTHGMNQKEFQPYLDFIDNTLSYINLTSESANRLFKMISEHVGYNILDIDDSIDEELANMMVHDFYDELNATVYGFQQGGIIDDPELDYGWIPGAFYDFDAYIKALSDIHEQYKAQVKAKAKRAEDSKANRAKKGKVYFDGNASGKHLSERQKASLQALRLVARVMGIDIHIFESSVSEDGRRQGANGWYDPVKKEIHIDLFAGIDGNGVMLYTAAHELTHHIKAVVPQKFDVFAEALLEAYTEQGISIAELIAAKIEKLKKNGRISSDMTEDQIHDLAYEEVIADACESMLVDSDAIEALSKKLGAKDKKLWKKIKDFIAKLVDRIRSAYEGVEPDSENGKKIREMRDSAENLQKLWVEALLEASEADFVSETSNTDGNERKSLEKNMFWIHEIRTTKKEQGLSPSKDVNPRQGYNKTLTLESSIPQDTASVNRNFSENENKYQDRDPDSAYSNRTLLMNALRGTAKNPRERALLKVYKDNLDQLYVKETDLRKVTKKIDEIRYRKSLSILGEEMSVKTFEQRARAKAEVNELSLDDLHFKLDRENAKYIAYVDGYGKILEADKKFRSEEETKTLETLSEEASKLRAEINELDIGLFELQSMEPLKNVLEREKELARTEAEQQGREALQKQREKAEAETDKLKAEHREKLKEQREKANERLDRQKERIMQQHHDAEEKARERKQKSDLVNQIKNLVQRQDRLLDNGNKTRNVKDGLQIFASKSLDLARVLFSDGTSNEDIVKLGVESATKDEKFFLKDYMHFLEKRDEYLKEFDRLPADKMDHLNEIVKELKFVKRRLVQLDHELAGLFERERERLSRTKVSDLMTDLANEYLKLKNSEDVYIQAAFDDLIYTRLLTLQESLNEAQGDKPVLVRDMNVAQLAKLYDMYKMVDYTIRKSNETFAQEKSERVSELATSVISEEKKLNQKKEFSQAGKTASSFSWNILKPVYAVARIASDTLTRIFDRVLDGESVWATDMVEAKNFLEEQMKKYKYDTFDFDKKHQFVSSTGNKFELDLGQIMSIFCYSRRGPQAIEHLKFGGFQFDDVTVKKKTRFGIEKTVYLNDTTAYKLDDGVLEKILAVLDTKEMKNVKAFTEAMQDYLSRVMGEKGNAVSLELHGIKIYNEEHYFPLYSSKEFLERAKEQANGTAKLKNKGFTKATVPHARTTIVLSSFMDVWANHVNEMSMYHAFALPMEDFDRVYHYKTANKEGTVSEGVISAIKSAHGKAAIQYIDQLFADLNGGIKKDTRGNIWMRSISNFKKAAVTLSLTVVAQQPTSIVRAQALVDQKFFLGKPSVKKHKADWAELKKYAPVASIKEMGSFDTGVSRSAVDWLKGEKTLMEKADDLFALAPAMADELTWCAIWHAVKRETASRNPKMNTSSKEFLRIAGKRFTEVIAKTQVYDSTLSRSGLMRSKDGLTVMMTSFMAEPTVSLNMMEHSFRTGNIKFIARTMGAVYGSVILNAAIVSFLYAAADDDEDETFAEKYVSRFVTEVLEGINPLTYVPFVKDIWSAAQGFDIERADMSLITSLFDSMSGLTKTIFKDNSEMDEEERKAHNKDIAEKILSVTEDLASLTGIPVKNIRREINRFINGFKTIKKDIEGRETSLGSLGDQVLDDVKSSVPIWGWFPNESKRDKLYDAIVKGDAVYAERLKREYYDKYEDEKQAESAYKAALRKALRENDPRIREAAQASVDGKYSVRNELYAEIVDEGFFPKEIVSGAISAEIDKIKEERKKQKETK